MRWEAGLKMVAESRAGRSALTRQQVDDQLADVASFTPRQHPRVDASTLETESQFERNLPEGYFAILDLAA